MTRSGFCAFGPLSGHQYCTTKGCACMCHGMELTPFVGVDTTNKVSVESSVEVQTD